MKLITLCLLAALCAEARPVRFYIGTYTDKSPSQGIYTGLLDTDTGKLESVELAAEIHNPSFLALAPNGKSLYAVTATNGGSVAAFRVEPGGTLARLNQLSSGNGGCHVSTDATGHCVFVANYGDGSIAGFLTKPDGSLDQQTASIVFTGSGPNLQRQKKPYAHSTYIDAGGRHVYACDLGTDHIWVFDLDSRSGTLTAATPPAAQVLPGSGPRHLAFSPDERFVFVNGEMGMNVTVFTRNADTGALTSLQTVSTLPKDSDTNGFTTAEIFCHPSGKWLYVSNRDVTGHGRDSLSVFAIGTDGRLTWLQNVPAGVKIPRGFNLDPNGGWLMVGGQNDNRLVVFKIDAETGKLSATDQSVMVGSPVCVIFAK